MIWQRNGQVIAVGARRTSGCTGDDGLARARWTVQQDTPHGRATVAMGAMLTVNCQLPALAGVSWGVEEDRILERNK
jgi:hypothetical protein